MRNSKEGNIKVCNQLKNTLNKFQFYLGNNEVTCKTIEIFRDYINKNKWSDARELFTEIRKKGKKLTSADKMNFTIGNVIKRIYHIIREECSAYKINLKETATLTKGGIDRIDILNHIFSS
jgi:translation initiation factor 2B subunit (eIF-2B alpha/beta/delta family)